jgi:7,8-dihydroneopterin aldolase/epimerase/oxygenase
VSDQINISELVVPASIGVTDEERAITRPLTIDISMQVDVAAAGVSDDLDDTVSYHTVAVAVAELVRAKERKLIEHLAEEIAALILTFIGVSSVTVGVEKPDPPIEEDIRAVSVRITRP